MVQATWDRPDEVKMHIGDSTSSGDRNGNSARQQSIGSAPFILSGTCSFKHKGITAVIGPVGCGKTTLLLSLLGETKVLPLITLCDGVQLT